jgi:hypothetical protein
LDALRGDISVAPDGSVWYFGPDDFYRVGDASRPAAGEPGPTTNGSVSWAPDGTAWLHHDGDLYRFADGSWSAHEVKPKGRWVGAVAVASDGPVWTLASVGPDELVRRLDIDGWTDFDPPRRFNVNLWGFGEEDEKLKAGASGDTWLVVGHRPVVDGERKSRGPVLVQFDGSTWTLHEPPGIPSDTRLALIDTAADGSLWAYYGGAYTPEDRTGYIGRYKDGEWAVLGPGDGVPLAGGHLGGFLSRGQIEAASNGDVWLTLHQDDRGAGTNCDGIARFDGRSWTQFLAGECVYGLDTADDGTLWLLAGTPVRDDGSPRYSHTYVITPEAVE